MVVVVFVLVESSVVVVVADVVLIYISVDYGSGFVVPVSTVVWAKMLNTIV